MSLSRDTAALDPGSSARGSSASLPWLMLLMLAATLLFWVDEPSWNQNSRLALTHSIVERGRLDIDDWQAITGDKSIREGHYYCDKAPGVSLLAVPMYAVLVGARAAAGLDRPAIEVRPLDPLAPIPSLEEREAGDTLLYNPSFRTALWLSRASVVVLSSLLGACALYLLSRWLCQHVPPSITSNFVQPATNVDAADARVSAKSHPIQSPSAARREDRWIPLLVVLAWLVGSPALAYSTALYGHQPCAAFLIVGAAFVFLPSDARVAGMPDADSRLNGLLAGASLGLAVLCEYPAALPVIAICAAALVVRGWRSLAWTILAGVPFALILALYHLAAFGSALKTGYDFVYLPEFAEGMAVNYGVTAPRLDVLIELLVGRHRGLYLASPIMLLATVGLLLAPLALRSRSAANYADGTDDTSPTVRRADAPAISSHAPLLLVLLSVLICAYYLCLNAGYYMWNGGAALGPRHCLPMLPFLALGLVVVARHMPIVVIWATCISIMLAVVCTFVGPEMPQSGDPIWEHAVPLVLRATWTGESDGVRATLGSVLGLPGLLGLIPISLGWYWAVRVDHWDAA